MPYGRQSKSVPEGGPTILAGIPASVANATPGAPEEEGVAAPSNPGGGGDAVNLTGDPKAGELVYVSQCQLCHGPEGKGDVLNPGSDDGTVPALNPIDSTLVSLDDKTNTSNIDLFIQNGSTPPGVNPALLMPAWGAQNGMSQQQIADVIAYLLSINK
jgi:mono/diheme cytochrome c family protein